MVCFLLGGQGSQGSASKEWSLWNRHLWTLHLNMENGTWEIVWWGHFYLRKAVQCLSLCRGAWSNCPTAGGSDREASAFHTSGLLTGEAGTICPGRPLRGGTLHELMLSLSVLWPLFALLLELVFREKQEKPGSRESKKQICLDPAPNTTEPNRDSHRRTERLCLWAKTVKPNRVPYELVCLKF